jgi:ABC-type branched-subunit amino acid transport system substrate-binding protein
LDSRFLFSGTLLWEAETNATGGMYVPEVGRKLPVRVLAYDDNSHPEVAARAVRRLIVDDGVDVLSSSASSEIQSHVLPLSEEAGVVSLNVAAPDSTLFERGYRYHLQCGVGLHGLLASRPAFWARHGLSRVANLYADFEGWSAVGSALREFVEDEGGLELILDEGVPRSGRWSTQYGPYPADFDGWPGIVERLAALRPDAVVISLPAPAEYRLVREMRRQAVWFKYLELMYGSALTRIGLGAEDLLYTFGGGGFTAPADEGEINVGGTRAELAAKATRYLPGYDPPGRAYLGLAIWAHLVERAGSMNSDAVMEQAHKESGRIVTAEGRLTWKQNGDTESQPGGVRGVVQFRRHPFTASLQPVTVYPEMAGIAAPVFNDVPYELRPEPWKEGRW